MNTEKKNQHYIPKFYLRNFSYEFNGKQIGIFNINNSIFFPRAKIKTQGSGNFFYGHDGVVEDNLAQIEGILSPLIREITSVLKVPKQDGYSHLELLTFVALMDLRNPVFLNYIKDSRKLIAQRLIEVDETTNIDKLVPKVSHDDAIKLALSSLPDIISNLSDLSYKLLINKTETPFITSDFPIIKYNQFLEKKKWKYGKTGYGNTGLQMFVPLSPSVIIVFYDSMIYKVGFKKRAVCDITRPKDVEQLNMLQVLNCYNTVFFNESITEHYIRQLFEKSSKFTRANKTMIELGNLVEVGDKKLIVESEEKEEKNLIRLGTTDCDINLDINGLKIHSNSKKIKLSTSIAQVRPRPKKLLENRPY